MRRIFGTILLGGVLAAVGVSLGVDTETPATQPATAAATVRGTLSWIQGRVVDEDGHAVVGAIVHAAGVGRRNIHMYTNVASGGEGCFRVAGGLGGEGFIGQYSVWVGPTRELPYYGIYRSPAPASRPADTAPAAATDRRVLGPESGIELQTEPVHDGTAHLPYGVPGGPPTAQPTTRPTIDVGDIRVHRCPVLEGTVVDDTTGKPVAGARVVANWTDKGKDCPWPDSAESVSREDGTFVINYLPGDGRYMCGAGATGYLSDIHGVVVKAHATTSLRLVRMPTATGPAATAPEGTGAGG